MILVDTSVWIRFLSNKMPYSQQLDELLGIGDVAGHEFVYGELFIDDRGGRRKLLAAYGHMYRASTVTHSEVLDFARSRNIAGRGIGWIDTHLLASALVDRLSLWTVDSRLCSIAEELGVAYRTPDQA
jgi:predicted nucleic acid-binding protein